MRITPGKLLVFVTHAFLNWRFSYRMKAVSSRNTTVNQHTHQNLLCLILSAFSCRESVARESSPRRPTLGRVAAACWVARRSAQYRAVALPERLSREGHATTFRSSSKSS